MEKITLVIQYPARGDDGSQYKTHITFDSYATCVALLNIPQVKGLTGEEQISALLKHGKGGVKSVERTIDGLRENGACGEPAVQRLHWNGVTSSIEYWEQGIHRDNPDGAPRTMEYDDEGNIVLAERADPGQQPRRYNREELSAVSEAWSVQRPALKASFAKQKQEALAALQAACAAFPRAKAEEISGIIPKRQRPDGRYRLVAGGR